jgi:SAM-dependent methyltransferase
MMKATPVISPTSQSVAVDKMEPVATALTDSKDSAPLQMEITHCTLCGVDDCTPVAVGVDFEYRTNPDEFLMVQCRRCGLVYLNPRPAEVEATRIYPNHYHAFQFKSAQFGLVYRVRRRLEAARLLKWCRGLPAEAKILDVGCGDGFHLGLLREFGKPSWQLVGVDVDPRASTAAAEHGLLVHCGSVEQIDLPERTYHLILMIMTIEHLPNPAHTLRQVAKLLAPGGRVIIVTDNVNSWDRRLFGGRHWGGYHFPRHTYLFNKQTLRALANGADLEVERIVSGMSPVNWVYSIRNWLDDWQAPRWLVNRFSLHSVFALSLFTVLDWFLAMFGQGAILQATFRSPTASRGEA